MSTDELTESSTLPPYPEMILSAIEALDEKEGSSKSSIVSYIESKYADHLPDAHPDLLEEHLQQMRDSGEVVMAKEDLFAKPDPSSAAPPKRGRGRPPKPRDPLAAAVAKVARGFRSGKPRGRPPKKPRTDSPVAASAAAAAAVATAAAVAAGTPRVKRGRGRPPKVKPPFAEVGFA